MATDSPTSLGRMFRENWPGILLTYAIYSTEFVAFAFMPHLLGKGLDGLIKGRSGPFSIYAGVMVGAILVGFFRRRLDTRIYSSMWAKAASKAITALVHRKVAHDVVINRSHLVWHYSEFFENTLPVALAAVVNIVVSLVFIVAAAPHAAGILLSVALAIAACYYLSCRIQRAEAAVQHEREHAGRAILAQDEPTIVDTYHRMARRLVARSDLDAAAFLSTGSLGLASEILVALVVIQTGCTLGTVTACLSYVENIVRRIDVMGSTFNQFKQVQLAHRFLGHEGPSAA